MVARVFIIVIFISLTSCSRNCTFFLKSKSNFSIKDSTLITEVGTGWIWDKNKKKKYIFYSNYYYVLSFENDTLQQFNCDCLDTLIFSLQPQKFYSKKHIYHKYYFDTIPFTDSMVIDIKYLEADTLYFK